jgi:hypothetical protein
VETPVAEEPESIVMGGKSAETVGLTKKKKN